MLKKVFWISLSLFLLALIFLGVYQFAFKHNSSNPIADPAKRAETIAQESMPGEDIARDLAFENFLNEPVLFPNPEYKNLYYYSPRDKQLKGVDYERNKTYVIMGNLPGEIQRLLWSPLHVGALALIRKDEKDLWYYLDFRNQSQVPLKPEMSRLAWSTLGDSIFYQFTDPLTGARSINMSDFDGKNWKKLTDLGNGDYFLSGIPQSSRISFWGRPNGLEENALESISITGENRTTIISGKFGGDYLWSPDGHTLLVGSTVARGSSTPTIGVVDENGQNYQDLRIPTLIGKMTWSQDNQTLYYAQPGAFPKEAILPNDYYGKPIYTRDTFWKMNIKTGKRERLVPLNEMSQAFDATNLFLSPDETALFFIDRESSKLYRISL